MITINGYTIKEPNIPEKREYLKRLMAKADNGNWGARMELENLWGWTGDKIDGFDDGEGPRGAQPFQ